MKTMKAMKKSATATGHAKLMQAKALNVKSLRMVKEHEKAMHAKSLQIKVAMQSKALTCKSAMITEIVMHNEIIEISYETNWGNMWWSLPAGESAGLMRKFRAIESGPKVVRFDYECGSGLPLWRMTDGLGPDGEPTTNFSYKWDFDNMKQRNMTTHLERNFRIIRMSAMMFA